MSSICASFLSVLLLCTMGLAQVLAQNSAESYFRQQIGNPSAVLAEGVHARQKRNAQEDGTESAQSSADGSFDRGKPNEVYQRMLFEWTEKIGRRRFREVDTAIDRDEAARQNMADHPDGEITPYVVGSNAMATGERFPETVAILQTASLKADPNGLAGLCTGVLVSDLTVLTAAHCVCQLNLMSRIGRKNAVVVYGGVANRVSGYLRDSEDGSYPSGLSSVSLTDYQTRSSNIDETLVPSLLHPAFCVALSQGRVLRGFDLALIYLTDERFPDGAEIGDEDRKFYEISVRRKIANMAWPALMFSPALRSMTVVGYGISDFVSPDNRYWAKVGVRVPIADIICGSAFAAANYDCVPGREAVLVDWHRGGDTCPGDSGGPAFIRYFDSYYLAGITSRSATGGRCGEGGVYTLLTPSVRLWIDRYKQVKDPTF